MRFTARNCKLLLFITNYPKFAPRRTGEKRNLHLRILYPRGSSIPLSSCHSANTFITRYSIPMPLPPPPSSSGNSLMIIIGTCHPYVVDSTVVGVVVEGQTGGALVRKSIPRFLPRSTRFQQSCVLACDKAQCTASGTRL